MRYCPRFVDFVVNNKGSGRSRRPFVIKGYAEFAPAAAPLSEVLFIQCVAVVYGAGT